MEEESVTDNESKEGSPNLDLGPEAFDDAQRFLDQTRDTSAWGDDPANSYPSRLDHRRHLVAVLAAARALQAEIADLRRVPPPNTLIHPVDPPPPPPPDPPRRAPEERAKGIVAVIAESSAHWTSWSRTPAPAGSFVRFYAGGGAGESVGFDERIRWATIWASAHESSRDLARVLPSGVVVDLHQVEIVPCRVRVRGRRG